MYHRQAQQTYQNFLIVALCLGNAELPPFRPTSLICISCLLNKTHETLPNNCSCIFSFDKNFCPDWLYYFYFSCTRWTYHYSGLIRSRFNSRGNSVVSPGGIQQG